MVKHPKSRYTAAPPVPQDLLARLNAIVDVLSGETTVSAAARSLGLSRTHFQTLMHRAEAGLLAGLEPRPAGRAAAPEALTLLQRELARLRRENARLSAQVAASERVMTVAKELLHGRVRPVGRPRRVRPSTRGRPGDAGEDTEPEPGHQRTLAQADELRRCGLPMSVSAALVGVHPATLRRWRGRVGCAVHGRAHRAHGLSAETWARAERVVRRLHGLIGAEALRRGVDGLSRRAAACVKAATLTAMERERRAAQTRVTIAAAGILRGLDAMYVPTDRGRRYALIAADGAVPFRTTACVGESYDAQLVERVLTRDLEAHGAPLVLRLDRASVHATSAVRGLLREHGVLVLQGPPHYPRFYGQLERQNREHRAWLEALGTVPADDVESCIAEMCEAVSTLWPRRSLDWHTPVELWQHRRPLEVDRDALREEVHDRATRLAREIESRGGTADLAERLAIVRTLELRGYLRQEVGGWC